MRGDEKKADANVINIVVVSKYGSVALRGWKGDYKAYRNI